MRSRAVPKSDPELRDPEPSDAESLDSEGPAAAGNVVDLVPDDGDVDEHALDPTAAGDDREHPVTAPAAEDEDDDGFEDRAHDDADAADDDAERDPDEDGREDGDEDDPAESKESRRLRKAREAQELAARKEEAARAKLAATEADRAEAESIRAIAQAKKDAAEADRASAEAAKAAADAKAAMPGFGNSMRRVLRKTARRSLVLLVLAALAVGAYFAWPTIDDRYFGGDDQTAADLTDVRSEVGAIESGLAAQTEQIAGELDSLTNRADSFEVVTNRLNDRLDSLAASQDDLASELDSLGTRIADQSARIDELDELGQVLGADLGGSNQAAAEQLERIKATELLSRARLFLYQANYGMARDDIASARATLEPLADQALIEQVITRLDLALANLPARPVAAAGDLDIAWRALLDFDADGSGVAPVGALPPASSAADADDAADAADDADDDDSADADEGADATDEADEG